MKTKDKTKTVIASAAEQAKIQVEEKADDQVSQQAESKEEASLTDTEQRLLDHHEKSIDSGLKSFAEIGTALIAIRGEKLYRKGYKTFEDYCQARWHMGRQYASRLIQSAECHAVLMKEPSLKDKQLPINESQIRALMRLEKPKERVKAWEKVLAKTNGEKITAEQVEAVVEEMLPNGDKSKTAKISSAPKQKLEKIAKLVADTLEGTSELTVPQFKEILEKIQAVIEGKKKKTA